MQQAAASQPARILLDLAADLHIFGQNGSALDLCAKKPRPLDRQSRAASDRAQPEHQSSKIEFGLAENVLLRILRGVEQGLSSW
jgi:hypothetical protein